MGRGTFHQVPRRECDSPGTHTVGGESQLLEVVFWPPSCALWHMSSSLTQKIKQANKGFHKDTNCKSSDFSSAAIAVWRLEAGVSLHCPGWPRLDFFFSSWALELQACTTTHNVYILYNFLTCECAFGMVGQLGFLYLFPPLQRSFIKSWPEERRILRGDPWEDLCAQRRHAPGKALDSCPHLCPTSF